MKRRRILLAPPLFLLLFLLPGSSYGHRRTSRGDVPFEFTAPVYNVTLEENAPAGTRFAISLDPIRMGVPLPEPDATVKFKIVENGRNQNFKAAAVGRQVGDFVFLRIRQKEKNGIIVPLNRELKDHYTFLVKATCKRKDASAATLETTATVHVTISDRNDASPMFTLEAERYEATIDDQTEPFTDVLQVEASDPDEGMNAAIYYSLANRSNEFTVDPITGWIRTMKPLRAGVYTLKVKAEDRTSRLFYFNDDLKQPQSTADVQIMVTETKKSPPKLLVETRPIDSGALGKEQLAAIVHLEGGRPETKVGLADDDHRHWFTVRKAEDKDNEWNLFTVPDQEVPKGSTVTLAAGAEFSNEPNVSAVIRVETTEKHTVWFEETKLAYSVHEAAPLGFVVGTAKAEVSYPDDKNHLRYSLEPISENETLPFRIDELTGRIRVAEWLDYETQKEYSGRLLVKLPKYKLATSTISLTISILDSNDHSPVWAAKWTRQGPLAIPTNAKLKTVLLKVDALDQDSGENGRIGYKLSSEGNIPFVIDTRSGEISLASPLPKTPTEWNFSVWAVDGGRPLSRAAVLNLVFYKNGTKVPAKPKPVVAPEPLNTAAPVFSEFPDTLEVAEDVAIGTVIATIKATDSDASYGGVVRCATWDNAFAIDAETCELSVAADLGTLLDPGVAEVKKKVEVIAYDQGNPPKNSTNVMTVTIVDTNNHAPVFEKPWYRIELSEDTAVGKVFLLLSATDADAGANGLVGYRNADLLDSVIDVDENSGKVSLKKPLDRETQDVMRFTIVAFDHGSPQRMSFTNLTIIVKDANDNPPMCVEPTTSVRIAEDYPDGALIGCIAARDADVGANGRLRFTIDSEGKPPFRIDHHTGCVFVHSPHRPLEYQRKPFYNISIDVADNGENMLSTSCYLNVELVEVNKNIHGPTFDDVAHEASVYENEPIDTVVYRVNASDADSKREAILYSIIGGDGIGYFRIDTTGVVHTTSILDREVKTSYWLTIQATDDATQSPRSAVLHLFVRVMGRNDHRPMPIQPSYSATVKENSAQNVIVVKIDADDADVHDDEEPHSMSYSIASGDPQSFFRIDRATGYITTSGSRKIDREMVPRFDLMVQVCDDGSDGSQLCTLVPVFIHVVDVNDKIPQFAKPIYHFDVQAGVAGPLCRVFAADEDAGVNGQLYYNITDGGGGRFSIDSDGYIVASAPMNEEDAVMLTVHATDMGMAAQPAEVRLSLTAIGSPKRKTQQNHAPKVLKTSSEFPISNKDTVGTEIGTISASDEDGDRLWWKIVDGNVNETFHIRTSESDKNTGVIELAKSVAFLPADTSVFQLKIQVSDGTAADVVMVSVPISRDSNYRPQFSALHYKTQVSEKTPIGSSVYTVSASGEPGSKKAIVYGIYAIEDVAMEDKLRIEPSSGNVVIMSSLDFEVGREIRAIISATQGSLTGYASLTVSVTDDNDNAPRFIRKEISAIIPSRSPIGTVVESAVALDPDSGNNGIVLYSIVSGNEMGYFAIDPITSVIRVAKKLSEDYVESILTIRATDGGTYPLSDTATVRILMSDDATESGRFTKQIYQRSVKESTMPGTMLMLVATTSNGHARYSMRKPCGHFEVHPFSGAVTLTTWLTRQRAKTLSCTVEATSRDGTKSTAQIVVKPLRTNEHAPVFKKTVYRAAIRENSPSGSAVLLADNSPLIVSAEDADSGPNSLIRYDILDPNEANFAVELVSGAIRAKKPLDYEKIKQLSLYVQATDLGQPQRSSSMPALVIVDVIDTNDNPPVFEKSSEEITLYLPTVTGVIVTKLQASDKDSVGKIRYFVKESKVSKQFAINSTSGHITVMNASEIRDDYYKFDVFASDGVHSASTSITIRVENVSTNNGFRFPLKEYTAALRENTTYASGHHVASVTAVGAPHGTSITYTILNPRLEFYIHSGTGMVLLEDGAVLDREAEPYVRLVIQAQSHEAKPRRAQTVLSIRVDDLNDNAPVFVNKPLSAFVSLDAKNGEKIMMVRAIDKDAGMNSVVEYTSSSLPNELRLDKSSGAISLNWVPTEPRIFTFTVEAADQGKPQMKASEQVIIEVVDKSKPVFAQQQYEAMVSESAPIGTKVASVPARSNTNGHLVYSIESGDEQEQFEVDIDSGVVSLRAKLDYEERPMYSLTLRARDVTRNKMWTDAVLDITVIGENDNSPVFERNIYHVKLRESTLIGTELVTVRAVDPDRSDGSGVSYAVKGTDANVVRIDADTGVVSLAQSVDYETKHSHQITLVASDDSQLSSEAKLVLEVEDVNDEAPRFVSPFMTAEVADTAQPGQFIAMASVTDEDFVASLPSGQKMLFSVIDGDETLFNVDKVTGQVTLGRTIEEDDMEQREKRLNISVSDGVYTAYGQLSVKLLVTGHRQPHPRFEQSQYVVAVRENNALSNKTVLLTAHAREGVPPLHYTLGGGKDMRTWPVKIDKNTGNVYMRAVLDCHEQKSYQIPLIVEDALGRRAFSTLTLNVLDENDSPPVFVAKKYSTFVSAASLPGEAFMMVSALDEDENDMVEYAMLGDNRKALDYFKINSKQGTISVSAKLDALVGSTVSFLVKATDSANPPHHASTEVTITIVGADVLLPKFSNSHYLFTVQEDEKVGKAFGKLQQMEQNVQGVQFALEDTSLPFSIQPSTGRLVIREALDREQRTQWRFVVLAKAKYSNDLEVHTMTTVTVLVADVNDNAPVFQGTYDRLTISEDAPVGTSIAVFSATDRDRAPGGRISFSLLEKEPSLRMDPESGWLLVASQIDRETRPHFELTARATDEGGKTQDLKFKLDVTDVNDMAPKFDKTEYEVSIDPAEVTSTKPILRVVVTDGDLPPFNQTRLFISEGNADGVFVISDDGKLSVRNVRLSALDKQNYELTLLAFDGKHSTTAKVKVKVKSAAATTVPECKSSDVRSEVRENVATGTVVYKESASDGVKFTYQLQSTEVELPFRVDTKSGQVVVNGTIDREMKHKYMFVRLASSATLKCSQTLHIAIIDENDNAPVFIEKEYHVTVKENQAASETERLFLLRVHAVDKDANQFGRIKYSLSDGYGVFDIDESSGAITVTQPLDSESKAEYTLYVLASDSDTEKPKADKVVVKVSVADQNDNAPVFEKKEYALQVIESESPGYELLKVSAVGGDAGEAVTYALAPNRTGNEYVSLDAATGAITLTKALDFEKIRSLSLVVIATDSGKPPMSSQAPVEIQILDENDNGPIFMQPSYKAAVTENAKPGTKVLRVEAKDLDSEHYGNVAYTMSSDVVPLPFVIADDGEISVIGEIDREKVASYRLSVLAQDGGTPPQTAEVTVVIDVKDENDNAPIFQQCDNLTAIVQESAPIGRTLLQFSVSDADQPPNGAPFKFSVKGDGAGHFRVDDEANLVTTSKFDHAKKNRFILTVVAKDQGGLTTDCPLTVFVVEDSMNAPEIKPLRIVVNTLMGEFRGGVIGVVHGTDKDKRDRLQYSLVDGSVVGPLPTLFVPKPKSSRPHHFRVDANSGEVWADHTIAAGLHVFNVSVTDGKFSSVSYVEVDVRDLEQDLVEYAVSIRLKDMTAEEFFTRHQKSFRALFAKFLNVRADDISFLSVQDVKVEKTKRNRRSSSDPERGDVEILFTVSRGSGRGMLKPDHIYNRLKADLPNHNQLDQSSRLHYSLKTELCTIGVCRRGECRERITLDDQEQTLVSIDGASFMAPRHQRTAECICPEGFGGAKCDVETNKCARSPCEDYQMCVPNDNAAAGFECFCPPGLTGGRCDQSSCPDEGRCAESAELSVDGSGFFEMTMARGVETRMEMSVEFRTAHTDGVVWDASGPKDYHVLELNSSHLVYRWDLGSGVGVVQSMKHVSDGEWHTVRLSRNGRTSRIVVDSDPGVEGKSPSGSEVLNLQASSQRFTFGAQVVRENDGTTHRLHRAIAACFREISFDGRLVSKTRQGLRLHNVVPSCQARYSTPCSEQPCSNNATCHVEGLRYRCTCPSSRYEGDRCEIDRDPCGSRPCPNGIQCIPYFNDYLCKCPSGFTGKRCESRGSFGFDMEDACAANPCGSSGTCITIPRQASHQNGFICNCTHGLVAQSCNDISPPLMSRYRAEILIGLLALGILVILCTVFYCIYRCIKNRRGDKKYGEHVHVTHMHNPTLAHRTLNGRDSTAPPPLPPRGTRNLPTVQVKPFNERFSSSRGDSRSPSNSGSGKNFGKPTRNIRDAAHDYGSAADDLDKEHNAARTFDALRRFGMKIPDDDDARSSGGASSGHGGQRHGYGGQNRAQHSDMQAKRSRDALDRDRLLGDSIQCLPTTDEDHNVSPWADDVEHRLARAERLRLESLEGRLHVGDTILSPLKNDDDYMTMRPRRCTDSAESQRRPLLGHDDDDGMDGPDYAMTSSESKPAPPAHRVRSAFFADQPQSQLYDNPAADATSRSVSKKLLSGGDKTTASQSSLRSSEICDIDASSDGDELPRESQEAIV